MAEVQQPASGFDMAMNGGSALDEIDFYLYLVIGSLVFSCVYSYMLLPHVDPTDKQKNSFLAFATGTSMLKYFRGPNDPPMTEADFPNSGGTPTANIESHAALVSNLWTPNKGQSLASALLRAMLPYYFYTHVLTAIIRVLSFIHGTYCMRAIIAFMGSLDVMSYTTLKLQILGFTISVALNVIQSWQNEILALAGTDPVFVGLQLMVLRKVHRLSSEGFARTSSAQAYQFAQETFNLAVALWGTPAKSVLVDVVVGVYSVCQLFAFLGPVFFFVTCLMLAFLVWVGHICSAKKFWWQGAGWQAIHGRLATTNHVIDNYKNLRILNWMDGYSAHLAGTRGTIDYCRHKELQWDCLNGLAMGQLGTVVTVLTFFNQVFIQGQSISFEPVMYTTTILGMVTASYYSILGLRGSYMYIKFICEKLEEFLSLPEWTEQRPQEGPLRLQGASFDWMQAADASTEPPKEKVETPDLVKGIAGLGGVNEETGEAQEAEVKGKGQSKRLFTKLDFEAKDGELVIVCGPVGVGKSSFLHALLGEMQLSEGEQWLPAGQVAFQPQLPYLMEGTIRDNILFGIPDGECSEENLRKALAASQLLVDINNPRSTLHEKRELTTVGKRGSSLSGGQRARTALARSVYAALQGAPLVLLDDPVASVDNEVVQAAWFSAVLGAMRGATRVVVVNTQLLERLGRSADRIVVLKDGAIAFNGTPDDCVANPALLNEALGGAFELVQVADPGAGAEPEAAAEALVTEQSFMNVTESAEPALALVDFLHECEPIRDFLDRPLLAERSKGLEDEAPEAEQATNHLALAPSDWRKFQQKLRALEQSYVGLDEGSAKGGRSELEIIWLFFKRMNFVTVLSGCLGVFAGFIQPMNYWVLRRWGEDAWSGTGYSHWFWFTVLAVINASFGGIGVVTAFIDGIGRLRLSDLLAGDIDRSLVTLSLPFFWRAKEDAEPTIRKVMNQPLDMLSGVVGLPVQLLQVLIGVGITSTKAPSLWLLMIVAFFAYLKTNQLTDWRNQQSYPLHEQMMAKTWTKIMDQYDCVISMRAMGRSGRFEKMLHGIMMVKPYFNTMSMQMEVLMSLCHHTVGATFNTFAVLMIIRMKTEGATSGEALAFFTLASTLSHMINGLVGICIPFRDLISRYRQIESFMLVPHREDGEGVVPPKEWPSQGRIEFEKVTFRYVPHAPAALKRVSFTVNPGEKVGVIGKTGSGKSTLVSLLLRLGPLKGVAPSSGGRVLLDGLDVATLSVQELRTRIAVVPQEPFILAANNLKTNVSDACTDAEVLTALEWCGLDARALTWKGDLLEALRSPMHESMMSVGQKQLLMAARALVKRPKVMILDECTASLDRETSDGLLAVINEHSGDASVLSIAHRLRFVLGSDRILSLAHGEVISFEAPAKLLEDPSSYFATNLRLEQQEEGVASGPDGPQGKEDGAAGPEEGAAQD